MCKYLSTYVFTLSYVSAYDFMEVHWMEYTYIQCIRKVLKHINGNLINIFLKGNCREEKKLFEKKNDQYIISKCEHVLCTLYFTLMYSHIYNNCLETFPTLFGM